MMRSRSRRSGVKGRLMMMDCWERTSIRTLALHFLTTQYDNSHDTMHSFSRPLVQHLLAMQHQPHRYMYIDKVMLGVDDLNAGSESSSSHTS
jgi:hypothetical protein